MADVRLRRFLSEGSGILRRPLGPLPWAYGFCLFGVELQFDIEGRTYDRYRNLQPINYAGPEALWTRAPSGVWTRTRSHPGTGPDGPDSGNAYSSRDLIAFYDNPGLNPAQEVPTRVSHIRLIQNFTSWIVGDEINGRLGERLCEVVAWHTTITLVDRTPSGPQADWAYDAGATRADTGWADTSKSPMP